MPKECVEHRVSATFIMSVTDVNLDYTVVLMEVEMLSQRLVEYGYPGGYASCHLLGPHAIPSDSGYSFDYEGSPGATAGVANGNRAYVLGTSSFDQSNHAHRTVDHVPPFGEGPLKMSHSDFGM